MSLEHAIKTLNGLDSYNEKSGTVAFYADEHDKEWLAPTVELRVDGGAVLVARSSGMPVNKWSDHAFAYHRAWEFLRLSGLSDSRSEQMGGR